MLVPEFVDDYGVTVTYYVWEAAEPVGVLQLAHGLGEHALRYQQFAADLNAAGYTVVANDHRGHGQTGLAHHAGDHSRLGRLGPGGLRAAVAVVHQLTGIIRGQWPSLPLTLLGHSWGSLMVQLVVNRFAEDYNAVVLTGTAYRYPGFMRAGDLNRLHRHLGSTGHEWLSRDPAIATAFAEDPLTFRADVPKLLGIVDGLRLFGRPGRRLSKDIPVLIQIGGDDSLGGERSVNRLAAAYRTRSGLTDVVVKIYPDARHEIFNETNREDVIRDLVAWLDTHGVPARD